MEHTMRLYDLPKYNPLAEDGDRDYTDDPSTDPVVLMGYNMLEAQQEAGLISDYNMSDGGCRYGSRWVEFTFTRV